MSVRQQGESPTTVVYHNQWGQDERTTHTGSQGSLLSLSPGWWNRNTDVCGFQAEKLWRILTQVYSNWVWSAALGLTLSKLTLPVWPEVCLRFVRRLLDHNTVQQGWFQISVFLHQPPMCRGYRKHFCNQQKCSKNLFMFLWCQTGQTQVLTHARQTTPQL